MPRIPSRPVSLDMSTGTCQAPGVTCKQAIHDQPRLTGWTRGSRALTGEFEASKYEAPSPCYIDQRLQASPKTWVMQDLPTTKGTIWIAGSACKKKDLLLNNATDQKHEPPLGIHFCRAGKPIWRRRLALKLAAEGFLDGVNS